MGDDRTGHQQAGNRWFQVCPQPQPRAKLQAVYPRSATAAGSIVRIYASRGQLLPEKEPLRGKAWKSFAGKRHIAFAGIQFHRAGSAHLKALFIQE